MTISNNPPKQIAKNRIEETVKYWRTKLESLEELQLPIDFARLAGNGTNRGSFNFSIDSNILSKIEKIGQHPGETLFIRLLAAYKILLYRWSGQEDLCVCLVENRILKQEPNKKFEFFKEIIPIRTQIQSDLDFDNLTKKIHQNVKEAHGFQEVPFESVMEHLNHEKDAIFQALFEFESKPKINLEVDKSDTAGGIYQQYSSKCAISFELSETKEGILGVVNYNSHLFKEKTIADFTSHYLKLLASISENSSLPIGRLKILSVEEENTLLHAFNLPEKRLPKDTTILDLFKNQVMKTPDDLAVVFENEKVTYRDLDIKSNQLANYLLNKGVKPENLIPICLDNSIEMIIGILGILKSGGAYVPIDPTLPDERIGYVLSDTRAELVLTTSDIAERLQIGMKLVILDSEWVEIEKMRESLTPLYIRQTQLVYVIYTSGSSGKPKGVMIEHKGLLAFLLARESYHQKKAASILLIPPFSFDASIPVIFETLTSGGRLILCKRETIKNPVLIKDKLEDSETILCVPSYYRFLLEEDLLAHSRMSKVILAGENLEESLVRLHFEKAKNVPLFNEYGPTECTVWATVSEIKSPNEKISIGKPIDYSSIYILNRENQLNPINVPGELCIAGETVARGYLNLPNLTSEKFTPNPYSDTKGSTMYHTGDLAKWLPDGNIEYLGRIDDQVKIFGQRIELGEIETLLQEYTGISQAVVAVKQDSFGFKRLIGYVVCESTFNKDEVTSFLRIKLPEYMVPNIWMELDRIPLTYNGKVNRKALPEPAITFETADYEAPKSGLQKTVSEIWQKLLGVQKVGLHNNFFELGGNSLLAMRVIGAIRKETGRGLHIRDLFSAPTVAQLALVLQSPSTDRSLPVPQPVSRPENIPLSHNQQALWFIHQLEGSVQYQIPLILNISSKLDISALEEALKTIVNRHEVLRTVITDKDGNDYQKVLDPDLWKLNRMDFKSKDPELLKNEIIRLVRIPFDLNNDHMIRACIVTKAPQDYCLVITMHHIALDGWSSHILRKELSECYQAITKGKPIPLAPLPLQYIDYAIWQRNFLKSDSIQTKIDYWKAKLQNLASLQFPTDFSRPTEMSREGGTVRFSIKKELISDLNSIGLKYNATLFMTLFSAFKVLMYRYTGQKDICIGTPVAGRDYQEFENLIGFFVNSIPLRISLEGNMRFDELLKQVQSITLDAFDNSEIPFEQIVESLGTKRELNKNPVFQIFFALQNLPENQLSEGGLLWSEEIQDNYSSKFDLSFDLTEVNGSVEGVVEFSKSLFRQETAERMAGHFSRLLESIIENPTNSVGKFEILTDFEKTYILENLNDTDSPLPEGKTILDLFENQVLKTPDAIALVFEGKQLTYKELDAQSNQLAHFLSSNGLQPESPVPICIDRSLEMVIGIFGILKSGGAYVPIDPTFPKDRIDYMIEDTKADFVVCSSDTVHNFSGPINRIILDEEMSMIQSMPSEKLPKSPSQEHLAYIIYTSGSTGKPKGAMVDHSNLLNFSISLTKIVEYNSLSRQLSVTTYIFDAFCLELFVPLINGGGVYLVKKEDAMDGFRLAQKLAEVKPTHMQATPSGWQILLSSGWNNPEGIIMTTGGEALGEETKNLLAQTGKLWNLYGPTETTITSTYKQMDVGEKVSIGKPIDNTAVYILGPDGGLNPVGIPGELCIGGKGVGRGYLNRPELTSEKFLPDPFSNIPGDRMYRTGDLARWLPDGNIEYLGRLDDQVKIRGYRIELGEIESVLLLHPSVNQAVVIAKENGQGDKRLVGYVVCSGAFEKESLISFLRSKLPEYMVPILWIELEKIPLTFSGKIDRKALPDIVIDGIRTAEYTPPRTGVEKQLAAVWQNFLGLDRVGIHDDFFELGGNSLLAVRIISALEKEIGSKIAVNQIFKYPNISELAKEIENSYQDQEGWNSLVAIKPKGTKPPFYIVHGVGSTVSIYYSLAKNIENDQPIYGFQPKGLDGIALPNSSIEEMAAYYISLMVKQNPNGPYFISGYSFGGYVAYEMAQQLRSMGKIVGKLVLFDTKAWEYKEKVKITEKAKLRLLKTWLDISFAFHEPKGFLEKKSRSFKRKRDKFLVLLKLKPNPKFLNDSTSVLKRVAKNNADILNKYRLVPYNGPLYLFHAKTTSFYVKEPKFYGWTPFVEKVIVINVSGHHDNIFHDTEILKEMAKKIQQVLDENSTS